MEFVYGGRTSDFENRNRGSGVRAPPNPPILSIVCAELHEPCIHRRVQWVLAD